MYGVKDRADRAKLVLERHMEHWMEIESVIVVFKVKGFVRI